MASISKIFVASFLVVFLMNSEICVGGAVFKITESSCVASWFWRKPLNLTCIHVRGSVVGEISISNGQPIVTCDRNFENCYTRHDGYTVTGIPLHSMTLTIEKFNNNLLDAAKWVCGDDAPVTPSTCSIGLSDQYSVLDENLTQLTNHELPFSLSVTSNCIYLLPNCSWMYLIQNETQLAAYGNLDSVTSSNTSCRLGQEQATCSLSMTATTFPAELVGKNVSISVSITHASLTGNDTPIIITSPVVILFSVAPRHARRSMGEGIIEVIIAAILLAVAVPSAVILSMRMKRQLEMARDETEVTLQHESADSDTEHPEEPVSGQEDPASGQENPVSGEDNPPSGQDNPDSGQENPDAGEENPDAGEENPDSEQETDLLS